MATNLMAKKHRLQLTRMRQRLESQIGLISQGDLTAELKSHYARYVCVLLSGYAEQAIKELLVSYANATANPHVAQYVASRVRRYNTISDVRLTEILDDFNGAWNPIVTTNQEQGMAALGSVVSLRNLIAHGQPQGIGWDSIMTYRDGIYSLIDELDALFFQE